MPNPLPPSTFSLHSRAVPNLSAGSYVVHTEQQISAPGATTETLDAHLEVTAPRFSLPPDQVLSTFPPNKAQGSFAARLPQIVLKRRTLPWEREIDPAHVAGAPPSGIPWLALVLLADAECQFRNSIPIADCVTAGVVLAGRNDVAIGDAIVVTDAVVKQVFPTKAELPLLAHVREVDFSDTELALGDDDGWLAVVLSNRLPQEGVRYRVCLISLEGQYNVLADAADVEPDPPQAFATPYVYEEAATRQPVRVIGETARTTTIVDGWSRNRGGDEIVVGSRNWLHAGPRGLGEIHGGDMNEVDPGAALYTFPVLANWQFTCTDGADFQLLMQSLDVGLLDTVLRPVAGQRGKKPPPPRTSPEPQVAETGHIELSHVDRGGDPDTVWYRGPLVPHPGGRDMPDAAGVLPLLHSSDQARRIGPDGRDNLSLAAAFEIGRLLALAEPSVVAAFLNWRKQGFEQARTTALVSTDRQLSLVEIRDVMSGFAARVGNRMLADLGANDAIRLGGVRPPVDGGCPIDGLDNVDVVQLIATGFGLPVDTVREAIDPGAQRAGSIDLPVANRPSDLAGIAANLDGELGHLRGAALDIARGLAANALAGSAAAGGRADALDELIGGGR